MKQIYNLSMRFAYADVRKFSEDLSGTVGDGTSGPAIYCLKHKIARQ